MWRKGSAAAVGRLSCSACFSPTRDRTHIPYIARDYERSPFNFYWGERQILKRFKMFFLLMMGLSRIICYLPYFFLFKKICPSGHEPKGSWIYSSRIIWLQGAEYGVERQVTAEHVCKYLLNTSLAFL